jgi:adenine deaminase
MENSEKIISGRFIDIHNREIYPASVRISGSTISKIERIGNCPEQYILPGLIDSHIHIESSMITPGAFSLTAVRHGTTGVVSDPHEIANVLGLKGVEYMLEDSSKVPLKFYFGAPSCVPATSFETSGSSIDSGGVKKLLENPQIRYLSEMMNYPGVIFNDEEVHNKLKIAKALNKPIDGHAPGLTGEMLKKYISSGISTDHECSTLQEALEKIALGMNILIREGSAARNLDALKDLFRTNPENVMLCSDDLHPEMLQVRHINKLVAKLVGEGYDIFDIVRSVTINPVEHYNLGNGLLREGDPADLIIVDNPATMNVIETWIDGVRVYSEGEVRFNYNPGEPVNNFHCSTLKMDDIKVKSTGKSYRVIKAIEGELITGEFHQNINGSAYPDSQTDKDILKIIVKDRYKDSPPVTGFINGFGLKKGAFASSVAHDSHNIIAVGTNDYDIVNAINEIIRIKGGLSVSLDGSTKSLQLNIGGIMTNESCEVVASKYQELSMQVQSLGCKMKAPFMTLSFMALLVIPDLKIGDKGLFDVKKFQLVPLFVE